MNQKENIKRNELKSNFLKQMIIRIDYDYLFEDDLESVVKNSYNYLIDQGYKMNSKTLEEYNLNVNINNVTSENNDKFVMEQKNNKEEYSSFSKNGDDIIIDITKNFTVMTVNYKKYDDFVEQIKGISKIIEEIKKVRKGLEIKRVGIRKINQYILKDITKINEYFEESVFSFNELLQNKSNIMAKQMIENFIINNYKVNELGNISKGIINNEQESLEAYQIIIDIDVYDDIVENNDFNLEEMNETVFEVYKSVLKEDFLKKLKDENFEDKEIIKI